MIDPEELRRELQSQPEGTLTSDIVIPLLKAMGFSGVRYVHGALEHGVDVLGTHRTPFGPEFCGVQVKAVPIQGDMKSKSGNVSEIINQVSTAFRHDFLDDEDNTIKSLDKFLVVTSHTVTQTARGYIRDALREFGRRVRFLDGTRLVELAQEYLLDYVTDYFARRNMVAEVSHILRGPLQGLTADLSLVSLMLSKNDGIAGVRDACRSAEENLAAILRMLRMYTWAAAPPESLGLALRSTLVSSVLNSALTQFQGFAHCRNMRFRVKAAEVGRVTVDPDAFELLLAILLDNAVKYGFARTFIDVRVRDEGKSFSIEIQNEGHIIPDKELPRIWEPHYRGTMLRDSRRYIPGTGLGLAVARDVAKRLGGSIEVNCRPSCPGGTKGTVTFVARFPKERKGANL